MLRRLDNVLEPDPRMLDGIQRDNNYRARLQEHIDLISPFALNSAVPIEVRIHFETAKNLYLYAFFAYRFHSVAEKHALETLEFALRERLTALVADARSSLRKPVPYGLSRLLDRAIREGLLRSKALASSQRLAKQRAKQRYEMQILQEMSEKGLKQILFDESRVIPIDEDYEPDRLQILRSALPLVRNEYAHGSRLLRSAVLATFEIVSELVNGLYSEPSR
jgi:hypothetical protein